MGTYEGIKPDGSYRCGTLLPAETAQAAADRLTAVGWLWFAVCVNGDVIRRGRA